MSVPPRYPFSMSKGRAVNTEQDMQLKSIKVGHKLVGEIMMYP